MRGREGLGHLGVTHCHDSESKEEHSSRSFVMDLPQSRSKALWMPVVHLIEGRLSWYEVVFETILND